MNKPSETVWPLHIKVIHWLIALIVVSNIYIFDDGDLPHEILGYISAGLVLIRFYFGFMARDHVGFSRFNLSLNELKIFFKQYFKKHNPVDYIGHNPAASLVYFTMWFLLIALGVSGWMMGLDYFWGNETLENIHHYFSNGLEVLVIIHLIGITIDAIVFKRKTWMSMIK